MQWDIGPKRVLYDSEWVALEIVPVDAGEGEFDHHVVRMPKPAVAAVVVDPARGVLLLWRHRFISDTWGWEIPAGTATPGEDLESAAAREVLEETGWRPGPGVPLLDFYAAHGIADLRFHVFVFKGAEHVEEPVDSFESERVEWVPVERIRTLIDGGEMPDGPSMLALLYAEASGHIG